jgi:predicted O-methyltransferase YrrM
MEAASEKPTTEQLQDHIRALYDSGTIDGESGRSFDLWPTGFRERDGHAMRDLAVEADVTRTIETGFAYGLSGLFLCDALLRVGNPDAVHVAIDPFQHSVDNAGLRNFRTAGLESLLEYHHEPSQSVLPRLWTEERQFDLGFIDGDHRFDGAFTDIYFMHRVVKPGGLIIVDDMWMPSITLAVRFFETNLGYVRENPKPSLVDRVKRRLRGKRGAPPLEQAAIFRRPAETEERAWNHFVPFT